MALLNFPVDPDNGDIYPQSPFPGQVQYQWDATNLTWRLLGAATGVSSGTYGDAYNVGQFTVDSTGRITFAQNVPIETTDGTVTEIQTGVGLGGGPITSTGTIFLDVSYTDSRYLQLSGGTMAGPIVFAAGQTFPGLVSQVNTGLGLTGGPITSVGTISLDTTYTDGRYLRLSGGTMTGPLRLPNGSISSPALTFAGGPFTGFYYDQTVNTINIARNGELELTIGGNETTLFSNVTVPNGYSANFTGTLGFFQSGGQVRFYDFDNSNYVGFLGPITATGNVMWRLPSADGTAGQVLTTNGAGQLSWGPSAAPTLQAVTAAGNTTTLSITANTVTTTGNLQITRGGVTVGLLSGDSGTTSFLPSSLTVSGTARISQSAYLESNGVLRFYETDNSNYIGLKAPSSFGADVTFTLPGIDGSSGDVLSTNGAGILSWIPAPANNLQAVTDAGSVTTNTITVAGIIAAGLTYPTSDGTSGQVIVTDGSGNLSWTGLGGGGTVTSISTDGGITGGPITGAGTISLTNTGVAAASYTYASITVDEKGRISLASSGTAPNTTVAGAITNTGTAVAPIIGIQTATTGQLGAVQVGTNIDVAAGVISVKSSSLTQSGIVQLNDTVVSTSKTEALTANQGKNLQDQITALSVTSNLTLAGTFDASSSQMLTVTSDGTAQSFSVGNNLPAAAAGNVDYFVIVTTPGNYSPPGGGGPYNASQGDWFLSNGTSWQYLNVGSDLPTASTGTAGAVELADVTETQTGTSTTLAITPAGAAATYLPISSFTAKGTILSASAANVPLALPVGSDNQILTACAAASTGLCWVTPPTPVAAIPCSVLTAKGSIVAATAANTPTGVAVGVNGQVLVACSTAAAGVCWQTPAVVPNATPGVFGLVKGCIAGGAALTALGEDALRSVTTGIQNSAVGFQAMCSATGAVANDAFGQIALCSMTTGCYNAAFGWGSGCALTTGCYNTLIGHRAGIGIQGVNYTTALGYGSLQLATGSTNIAIGALAGKSLTTGCLNVIIGSNVDAPSPTGNCQLAIGYDNGSCWLIGDSQKNICTTNSFIIPRAAANCPAAVYNNGDTGFYADGTFGAFLRLGSTFTGGDKAFAQFFFNQNIIGRINSSGTTGTQYLTNSDYRLKENVKDLEGATEVLRALPVREYNFISDPEVTRQGFLAHELQEFVPQAVYGEKDKVDEEGNPDYQGVDASQVVPLLAAALKESIARIDALEKKVAELGG